MTRGAAPLEGVKVYVFNDAGSYPSLFETTDINGTASFRLPQGTYKFRADHQGSQYWATETVNAHQVNVIVLNLEQLVLELTNNPLAGRLDGESPVYRQ